MIGIELPENDTQAFGFVVPAFDALGYGCVGAVDEEADLLAQAKLLILDMAEEVIADGKLLASLDQGYCEHSAEYPEFTRWIALDVPVEQLKAAQKRINITLPEPMLARVDAFVETKNEYKDRSDFLAKAADKLMAC
ncbi:type II toxin-antitoxin system HicB family antitoxin [Neiella marina]|nr:type II toxin-antitoxin system HicB family antitoxin [Neiella marina]